MRSCATHACGKEPDLHTARTRTRGGCLSVAISLDDHRNGVACTAHTPREHFGMSGAGSSVSRKVSVFGVSGQTSERRGE